MKKRITSFEEVLLMIVDYNIIAFIKNNMTITSRNKIYYYLSDYFSEVNN